MGNSHASSNTGAMAQVLSEVSLFSFLSDEETQKLATYFKAAVLRPDTAVVEQGTSGRAFYVIADGLVWTEVGTGALCRRLASKRKYDFFGELAVVQNGVIWSTTMRAGPEGCTVLVLSQDAWQKMRDEFEIVHTRLSKLAHHTMGSVLKKISVFNGIPAAKLGVLSSLFSYHLVNKGSIICREGSYGDSMYIIAEGSVRISAEGSDRCARDVRCQGFLIKKGGPFGTWRRRYCKLHNNVLSYYACDEEVAAAGSTAAPKRRNHRRRSSGFQSAKKFLQSLEGDASIMVSSVDGSRVSTMGHGIAKELVKKGEVEVLGVQYFNNKPNAFEISTAAKSLFVCADSPAHREEWISCIRDGIHASELNKEETAAATATTTKPDAKQASKKGSAKRGSDEDAPQPITATLEAGSYFGEIALVAEMPRTATVMAASKCTLLELKKENFQNFLQQMPDDLQRDIELLVRQRTATNLSTLRLPFLAGFSPQRLNMIANMSLLRHYAAGEDVIRQGEQGVSFYIILHGECEVVVAENGESKVVNKLRSGQYFGEIALLMEAPRLATVRAAKRTTVLEIEKTTFLNMFANDSREALADFELKVVQRKAELSHVISHPIGLKLFTQALKKEYSAENINFWKAVEDFREKFEPRTDDGAEQEASELGAIATSGSGSDIIDAANQLYSLYIGDSAPEQINVPDDIRAELDRLIDTGDASYDMFDEAQDEIYTLMENDNFARFKKSELFDQLMASVNPYTGDAVRRAGSSSAMRRSTAGRRSSTLPSVREAAEAVAGRNGGKPAVTGATSSSGAGVGAGAGSGAGAGAGAGASPAAVPAVSAEAGDGGNTAEAPATVAVAPPQPPDAPVASVSNAPALPRQVTPQDTAKPEESSASAADNGEPGEGAAE